MTTVFEPVELAAIEPEMKGHLASLPSAVDSFLEEHILVSSHYRILVDQMNAGFASIHQESLITQFSLSPPYRQHGQELFSALCQLEQTRSAFVPTCDELYLSHALDAHRTLAMQAYFFTAANSKAASDLSSGYSLQPASSRDIDFIRAETGEFFEPIDRYLRAGQLFLTMRHGEPVGFGLMVRSALYDDVASIGMFTIAQWRRQGVGTATISLLCEACRRRRLRAVAGCWYFNHRSKRTLEAAGMYSPTRLLKIDY